MKNFRDGFNEFGELGDLTELMVDWERRALRELYSEYRHILAMRRIFMPAAAIEFCDSTTYWGRWNPETRAIELSRKLLREYPWFQVLGILKHEMAHQLVDETYGEFSHHRPHGDRFQWACAKIGVPSEYSGATANLQTASLDWRTEKTDELSERMLEKVRKLLALATSANEHEAALAMNRVREIYAKYNLEAAPRSQFVHLVITRGSKRLEPHEKRIISILVGHFFVQVISGHTYHVESGENHRMIELIGRRENVLMAEYVYHFLFRQTEQLVEKMVRESLRPVDRVTRKSYRLGVLQGFSEKLSAAEKEPSKASGKATATDFNGDVASGGGGSPAERGLIAQALTQFREDREIDSYLARVYPRLRNLRSSAQRVVSSAYSAGKSAGASITLNKPVTSSRGFGGMLSGRR